MPRPSVWTLNVGRAGDDAQLDALAARLGADIRPVETRFNLLREIPNAWAGASLASLSGDIDLGPPWPDLVIGIGRRSVPLSRLIRRKSGRRAKLVRLGRPRAPLECFDLVIATPQYGLPLAPNVVTISLPFSADPPPSAAPPDGLAVILGGDSWSRRIDEMVVRTLADHAKRLSAEMGLAIRAATSPRTNPEAARLFVDLLRGHGEVFAWSAQADHNPYRAFLNSAATCLITGDSASTLADAVATGANVAILDPPERRWLSTARGVAGPLVARWLEAGGNRGFLAPPPNVAAIWERFLANGLARRDDEGLIWIENAKDAVEAEHAAVAARVRALLQDDVS